MMFGSIVLCAVVVAKITVGVWKIGTERLTRRPRSAEGQRE